MSSKIVKENKNIIHSLLHVCEYYDAKNVLQFSISKTCKAEE